MLEADCDSEEAEVSLAGGAPVSESPPPQPARTRRVAAATEIRTTIMIETVGEGRHGPQHFGVVPHDRSGDPLEPVRLRNQ